MSNVPMKDVLPNPQHLAFRKALEDAIRDHASTMDAMDILAVLSHLVGQVIALQDQRKVTPAMAVALVEANMERGNIEVIDGLLRETGGSA